VRAEATFTVSDFTPAELIPAAPVATGTPAGAATMAKHFTGDLAGRSATLFTFAYNQDTGVGTYLAMESFDGSLHGRTGAFNFAHSASTTGTDRRDEFFVIVPSSGTGDLAGVTGTGGLAVDPDGTHRLWLEYELT
jgi:hypothetical protein